MKDRAFEEQFKALFRENFVSMCLFADKCLGNMEQARDVVHDIFSQLWQRQEEIAQVSNIRNYTYTIVHNRCIDLLRRQNLHAQYVRSSQQEYISSKTFFETETIREDVYALLDKAIQRLPQRSREVILLKLKGYKNREIGEKLHISVNTVNTLKSNAYKTLRALLEEEWTLLLLFLLVQQSS